MAENWTDRHRENGADVFKSEIGWDQLENKKDPPVEDRIARALEWFHSSNELCRKKGFQEISVVAVYFSPENCETVLEAMKLLREKE